MHILGNKINTFTVVTDTYEWTPNTSSACVLATLNYTPDSTTYQITFSLGTVSKSDSVSEADLKLWP